jgi:2Fe-2S ferredoxin
VYKINVKTHDGVMHEVPFEGGENLLDLLDDHNLRLRSDCGGLCACVTCHVYLSYPYSEIVDCPDEDEKIMLTQVYRPIHKESRLACEVVMDKSLDGMTVKFAPGSEMLGEEDE